MISPKVGVVLVVWFALAGLSTAKVLKKVRKARTLAVMAQTPLVAPTPLLAQSTSEWDDVRSSYGTLLHIAGTAFDQDINSWRPEFEGANALTVELSNPHMAAADVYGNVYIADKESNSIVKVTPSGTIHTVAGTHTPGFNGDGPALQCHLNQPNGVFVLADGTFYIVDLFNGRIRRVGTNGQLTTVVEVSPLGGRALWVSPDEQLIYFAGRDASNVACLRRWTPTGGSEVVATGFVSLGNIAVDGNNAPIVTDDGGNLVYRIGAGGTKTVIAGNGTTSGGGDGFAATATGLNRVRGVACLPNGGFFLATQKGAHIWYVDTGGIIHKMMDCAPTGSVNSGNGELFSTSGLKMSEPRAITIAPNGDLLITASDFGQVRVVKCVRPPAAPEQFAVERASNGQPQLRWNGTGWQSYFVEHTPTLTPTDWQVSGIVTSLPNTSTVHPFIPAANAGNGFYRLRMPR